ncbi:MAG: hypothetical protein QXP70_04675 [Methanomassiliicoccales archaeon]
MIALRVTAVAVILLLFISLLIPVAYGDGYHRSDSLEFNQNGGYFTINSVSRTSPFANAYSVVFAQNTLLLMFKNSLSSSNYSMEFYIQLLNMSLVTPSGSSVQLMDFSNTEFRVSSYQTMEGNVLGINVYARNEDSGALFMMTAIAVNETATVSLPQGGNVSVEPNGVELYFTIIQQSSEKQLMPAASQIVLNMRIAPGGQYVPPSSSGGTYEVVYTQGKYQGYFSWPSSVKVDGSVNVMNSTLSADILSFAVPYGSLIQIDPFMGLSPTTLSKLPEAVSSPSVLLFGIALVLTAVAVGTATIYRERNK